MRRSAVIILGLASLAVAVPPMKSFAQSSRKESEDDARRKAQDEAEKKKKEKEKEWDTSPAPLPTVKNAGPCPFVKVLYDASRYAEFKDGKEAMNAVAYTGEIQGINASCAYKSDEPIRMQMNIGFTLGRGPLATSSQRTYKYWVAVTSRNQTIIARQDLELQAVFPPGADRVNVIEHIGAITIPRAKASVAGDNFEVLVGFDVTPEMAEFNRLGKRFRPNVTSPLPATASAR